MIFDRWKKKKQDSGTAIAYELAYDRETQGDFQIDDSAFASCSNLHRITIPDTVERIGKSAFRGCPKLADENGFVIFQNILFDYVKEDLELEIPEGVTVIGDEAFEYRREVTSIVIPDSVTEIGACAFSHCESLKEIVIPEGVTKLESSMCDFCENLQSVHLPESLAEIESCALHNCSQLEHLTVPAGVQKIEDDAFTLQYTVLHVTEGSVAHTYAKELGYRYVVE